MISCVCKRIPVENKRYFCIEWPTLEIEEAAIREIKRCYRKYNDYYRITIAPPYKKRTTGNRSQNHCINGWIQIIASETGNDFHYLKYILKCKAITRGYPIKHDDDGKELIDIEGNPIPESEANINTVQAGYLIEEIQQLAAELPGGIFLPEEV